MRRKAAYSSIFAALAVSAPARAIVLYNFDTNPTTGSSTTHTEADLPTGTLSNSGFKYEGEFTSFLPFTGTAIGPHAFITSTHTSLVGNSNPASAPLFTYNGRNYPILSTASIGRDMTIAVVGNDTTANQPIPYWAPMYNTATDGSIVGKTLVDMGRGTTRGDPITVSVSNGAEGTSRGWTYGPLDSKLRWGTNVVKDVYVDPNDNQEYFRYSFDRNGLTDEATLSGGDSGGGVFIKSSDGVWKLAGTNHSVSPVFFRYSPNTPTTPTDPLQGNAFDYSDLYLQATDGNYYQAQVFFPGQNPIPQIAEISNATDLSASTFAAYVPHAGDVNTDGKVNAMDFNVVASNFGVSSGALWTQGDLNFDGKVNAADFVILANNFGYSGTAPTGAVLDSASGFLVPEPTGLAAVGVAALLLRRRRG